MVRILARSAIGFRSASAEPAPRSSWDEKLASLKGLITPIALAAAGLGSILGGVASVPAAAAVGAFGSMVIQALTRGFSWTPFREAADRTLLRSALIFWIIIGAGGRSRRFTPRWGRRA